MRNTILLLSILLVLSCSKKEGDPVIPMETGPADCSTTTDEGIFELWDTTKAPIADFIYMQKINLVAAENKSNIASFDITSRLLTDTTGRVYFTYQQAQKVKLRLFIAGDEGAIGKSIENKDPGTYQVDLYAWLKSKDYNGGCYRLYYMFLDEDNTCLTKGHYDLTIHIKPLDIVGLPILTLRQVDTAAFSVDVKSSVGGGVTLSIVNPPSKIAIVSSPLSADSSFASTIKVVTLGPDTGSYQIQLEAKSSIAIRKRSFTIRVKP